MSEIKVDTLTGKTAANDITVTVGATATMSLEQGLAKVWVNFNGTGTIATRSSLNVSGLVDNGSGDYLTNFINSFSAADYACSTAAYEASRGNAMAWPNNVNSNINRICGDAGPTVDSSIVQSAIHGDLA